MQNGLYSRATAFKVKPDKSLRLQCSSSKSKSIPLMESHEPMKKEYCGGPPMMEYIAWKETVDEEVEL